MSDALWGFVGVITGGTISAIVSFIATKTSQKSAEQLEEKRYKSIVALENRKDRIKIYTDLARILAKLQVFIDDVNDGLFSINKEALVSVVTPLNDYFDLKDGELLLFLPPKIYSKLTRLRADCYHLIHDEATEFPVNQLANFKSNPYMKACINAQELIRTFQKELQLS